MAAITDLSQHRATRTRVRALDGIARGRYENADDAAWGMIAAAAENALARGGLSADVRAKLERVAAAGRGAAGLPPKGVA